MRFSERLADERKKRAISAEAMAALCGVSRSYITLLESGKRLPGVKVLPKIADAFGMKTVTVLDWYLEEMRRRAVESLRIES